MWMTFPAVESTMGIKSYVGNQIYIYIWEASRIYHGVTLKVIMFGQAGKEDRLLGSDTLRKTAHRNRWTIHPRIFAPENPWMYQFHLANEEKLCIRTDIFGQFWTGFGSFFTISFAVDELLHGDLWLVPSGISQTSQRPI